MSRVYQPVMQMTLHHQGGEWSVEEVSRAIPSHDQSHVEHYETVTNNMVGRVPRSHWIVERAGRSYRLAGYGRLTLHRPKS